MASRFSFRAGRTRRCIEYNVPSGTEITRLRVGPHTTDMVLSDRNPEADEADADDDKKPQEAEEKSFACLSRRRIPIPCSW